VAGKGAADEAGTIAFDYETTHGIVRNLRSIGTLYNQSVTALDTIAKIAREPQKSRARPFVALRN
jgi:hypothetical protein